MGVDQLVTGGSVTDPVVDSLDTEVADSNLHVAGYALETVRPNIFDDVAGDYRSNNPVEMSAMVQDHDGETKAYRATGYIGSEMYITDQSGRPEPIGDHANGPIQELCPTPQGEWLVEQATTYVYSGISNATGGAAEGSSTEPAQPLSFNTVPFVDDSESNPWDRGWIMADYGAGDPSNPRVWKVLRNGSFQIQLDPSDVRHFHSFDWDPFNAGDGYVTSGDQNSQISWWTCSGWGETSSTSASEAWTENSETAAVRGSDEAQEFRTLRINFTQDHLYWGMDYLGAKFFRASRGDLAGRTTLFDPSDLTTPQTPNWDPQDLRVFGSTHIPEKDCIVVGYQDTESGGAYDTLPLGLWDYDAQQARLLTQIPTDYTKNNQPGVVAMSPYSDQNTGEFYIRFRGVPNRRGVDDLFQSFRVQRLMG